MRRTVKNEPVVFPATVVIDTREQEPYTFASWRADAVDGGGPLIVPTQRLGLESGDYSLAGLEGEIAVERKSLADLYGTLGQGRKRFERELERLAAMMFAAVVVEAEWSRVLTDPPPFSQLKPKTVFRSVLAWQQRYPNIHWNFVVDRHWGELFTLRILERFWRERLER